MVNRLHVALKGNKTTKDIKFLEASPHSNIYIFRLTELAAAGFKSITHNLARVLKGRRGCENTRTDQTGASPLIAHTSAKTVLPTIFPQEEKKKKKQKHSLQFNRFNQSFAKASFLLAICTTIIVHLSSYSIPLFIFSTTTTVLFRFRFYVFPGECFIFSHFFFI